MGNLIAIPILTSINYIMCVKSGFLKKNGKLWFVIITTILFVLFLGLRGYTVGTDTVNYQNIFNYINQSNYYPWSMEKGYMLLNRLAYYIDDEFWAMNLLSAIISMGFIFRFIYKSSKNIFYSIMIFYFSYCYFAYFNIIRQGLAVAIAVNAMEFIEKGKWFKACIIVAIAGCFHISILILIPFLVIWGINKKMQLLTSYFISVGIGVGLSVGFRVLVGLVPRYQYYLNNEYRVGGNFIYALFLLFVVLFPIIIRPKNIELANRKYMYASSFIIVYILINIFASLGFESIMSRLELLFIFFLTVFIPEVNTIIHNKKNVFFYNAIIITTSVIYFVYRLMNNVHGILPYSIIQY